MHPSQLRSAVDFRVGRLGYLLPLVSRSVWFHGEDVAAFERASRLIALVRKRVAHHRILLTSRQPAVYRWLVRRFPNDAVAPAPHADRFSAGRFLEKMKPSALILIESADGLGRTLRTKMSALDIPVRSVSLVARRGETDAAQRVLESLAPFLPRSSEQRTYDREWWQKGFLSRFSRTAFGTALARTLGRGRIESFEALNERLGKPKTILCLGNGPSSEDPRLRELPYDCLFRTNWLWKHRGVLDHPQFVFVGSFQTPLEVSECVFGFRDIESERAVLLRNLKRPWRRPIEYFTIERVNTLLHELDLPARPTSGVLMILVAAALRPQEIIIAGMDLFSHPDGRYPGDSLAENDYAQPHDRQVEVMLMRRILAEYPGTVRVLGDALSRELQTGETAAAFAEERV
jgi:hypothetical protein